MLFFADDENKDPAKLVATYKLAVKASIFLFLLLILVVCPLFLARSLVSHQRMCRFPFPYSFRLTSTPRCVPSLLESTQITDDSPTQGGFTAWIIVAFVWVFWGMGAVRPPKSPPALRRLLTTVFSQVVIFPIFESRKSIAELFSAIVRDVFGGGKGAKKQVVAA